MARTPRVAIIHNIPISYKHLLFSELVRKGLDFEVLFLASGSKDRIEAPDLRCAPYRSRIGFQGGYEAIPHWHTASYVWRSLNEIQPSAVIISGWAGVGAWTARLWCMFHRRPSILWAESNQFDRPRVFWKELVKATFLRGFAAAQVYGTTNAEYLVELGFDSRKIWSKRAVADVKLFRPVEQVGPRDDSRKVILFVGRLAPEKNLEFVLEAVQRLPFEARHGLLLRFVGYGPLEVSLRLKAESLGLNDMVEFAGSRKHSELPEVYHSADVLLLPSTSEPWGLTVNEGMLCGLPAIVSECCGCARDLVNSGTGWSFNPRDSAGFARILEKVAAMPLDDLRAMGKNVVALARSYSPENCARVVMECLSVVVLSAGETR
ncbi:MAG: glycosyltransferase family 4 protein [Bryobacterales bacterium]|nr:glycosyltransferase family 4 protein [Bryobacterales bacterium]